MEVFMKVTGNGAMVRVNVLIDETHEFNLGLYDINAIAIAHTGMYANSLTYTKNGSGDKMRDTQLIEYLASEPILYAAIITQSTKAARTKYPMYTVSPAFLKSLPEEVKTIVLAKTT